MDKENNNKKDIRQDIIKFISNNYKAIIFSSFVVQLNFLIIQLFFNKSNIVLNLLSTIIPIFIILIFKDYKDVDDEKVSIKFRGMILIGLMLMFNHILINFFNVLSKSNGNGQFLGILLFFDIGIIIAFIGLSVQEGIAEMFEKIETQNYSKNLVETEEEEIKPGDAIIGYEVDLNVKSVKYPYGKKTKKPVILPINDRFLHMLILGPTGSGKTSQSIIPMINRDLQNEEMGVLVLEPKGDLAEKVYAMAKIYNRDVLYFNPLLPDCPYFNPLHGDESDVIENMATTFNMLNPDSPQFFKDMTDNLIRKGVKLLKRLYGDDATLIDLNTLVWDTNGEGRKMVMSFGRIKSPNPDIQKENEELVAWFLNDYYSGMGGGRGGTKTYEHCSGVRTQISKLISNKYLRKVLNPPKGVKSDIDFDKALADGTIVTMTTAQGAFRELGRFLGYFVILQLQASVFRRPGNEDTRRHCMLYIDEFQVYSNPGFGDMLTMGRSYRVASHLATQARAQIGMGSGKDGKAFIELVSANARNKLIYPGVSYADAKYYSDEFGEQLTIKKAKTYGKKRFLSSLDEERVSTSIKEEMENRFSPSDIIFRPFKQITYSLIKHNSVSVPGVSEIDFIPKDLNKKINQMVEEYNQKQAEKDKEILNLMEASLTETDFSAKAYIKGAVVKPIVTVETTSTNTTFKDPLSESKKSMSIEDEFDEEFNYSNDDNDELITTSKKTIEEVKIDILGNDLNIAEDEDGMEEDDLF